MKDLRYEPQGAVVLITIDRPAAMNAISADVRAGLYEAFERFEADDHRSRRWSGAALEARKRQTLGLSAVWTQKTPSLTSFALRFALSSPLVASATSAPPRNAAGQTSS
mgnify:CR=1 FL=1